jgi:hypothetical protein
MGFFAQECAELAAVELYRHLLERAHFLQTAHGFVEGRNRRQYAPRQGLNLDPRIANGPANRARHFAPIGIPVTCEMKAHATIRC